MSVNRVIWILWLQGWEHAPRIARSSLTSWKNKNPNWQINVLTLENLERYIPRDDTQRILDVNKPPEAVSDLIRLELLHRYGGVWADATTICGWPLDDWLHEYMHSGFFAFDNPGPNRMLSTWFLAAEQGSPLVQSWRQAAADYWQSRMERDDYYWVHKLFASTYQHDASTRAIWDQKPEYSARHAFHFGGNDLELLAPANSEYLKMLANPPVPVIKLTHKVKEPSDPSALMEHMHKFASAEPVLQTQKVSKRVLFGWYGSFDGHGTVGDLLAVESAICRLVSRGHEVFHASAGNLEFPGAVRVDWKSIDPQFVDCAIFVCGPIAKNHPQLKKFFSKFCGTEILGGVSVSLFPGNKANYTDPFDFVLSRQCGLQKYGDIAVTAPISTKSKKTNKTTTNVGVVLRGFQADYGGNICLNQDAEDKVSFLISRLSALNSINTINIENKLSQVDLSAPEIEAQYSQCDLVITTRFHGAIGALRNNVPFIAIDQIERGGKLYEMITDIGWPYVYRISHLDDDTVFEVAKHLLRHGKETLVPSHRLSIRNANVTLAELDRRISD